MQHPAEHSPLGKTSEYVSSYTPSLLFPISRTAKWAELGLSAETLPYRGVDIWNCYELSWLTPAGKPVVAIGEFSIPADSPNIIESKSFKLYLNSLNQSAFDSREALRAVLQKDLSAAVGAPVGVRLRSLDEVAEEGIGRLPGRCIDELDIAVDGYEQPRPELLRCDAGRIVEEQLYSHLLKSNCPSPPASTSLGPPASASGVTRSPSSPVCTGSSSPLRPMLSSAEMGALSCVNPSPALICPGGSPMEAQLASVRSEQAPTQYLAPICTPASQAPSKAQTQELSANQAENRLGPIGRTMCGGGVRRLSVRLDGS